MFARVTLDDAAEQLLLRLRLRWKLARAGLDEQAVAALVAAGLAAAPGAEWVRMTPAGRADAEVRFCLAPGSEPHARVTRAYEQFLPLNALLLRVCHEWEGGRITPGGRDAAAGWALVDRLGALDERAGPVLRRLGRAVPRYDGYRPRLLAARRRVEDGETEWLGASTVDSYHRVWWDLHEDLLVALGIERGEEAAGGGA